MACERRSNNNTPITDYKQRLSDNFCHIPIVFFPFILLQLSNGIAWKWFIFIRQRNNNNDAKTSFPSLGLPFQTKLQDTDRIWRIKIQNFETNEGYTRLQWSLQSPRAYSLATWSTYQSIVSFARRIIWLVGIRGNFDQRMTPSRIVFFKKYDIVNLTLKFQFSWQIWMVLPLLARADYYFWNL